MRSSVVLITALLACGDNNKVAPADVAPPVVDAPAPTCTPVHGTNVTWRQVAAIGGTITIATSPPDDHRLFAVIEDGEIWIVDNGKILPEAFLEAETALPMFAGGNQVETGLLGLAFHPQYATNRTFYVFYTAHNANDPGGYPFVDVLERFTTDATNPNKVDPASGTILLSIPDFAGNHNGGMLQFGPDGDLYISTGDGGYQEDPARTGQNPHALLGKILRIDVDHAPPGVPYAIPPDNPFADGTSGAPEVFIMGLRNPWRFAFDRANGDLWIGDVGQDTIEELDRLPRDAQNGANLGWSMYEGNNCFHPPCDPTGMTFPVDFHTHDSGWCAVIGGDVYRGSCFPDLQGRYFFSDFCTPHLQRADVGIDGTVTVTDQGPLPGNGPASLHADASGELYLTDIVGNIFQLTAGP